MLERLNLKMRERERVQAGFDFEPPGGFLGAHSKSQDERERVQDSKTVLIFNNPRAFLGAHFNFQIKKHC